MIAWGGLATDHHGSWYRNVHHALLQTKIIRNGMENIEELTFILMNSFDLYIE
jgi:hypothetical protein